MKRITLRGVTVFAFCLALLMGCVTYRKGEDSIRQDLLKETPLGTVFDEVEAKLKRKYAKVHTSPNVGFLKMVNTHEELVGSKSISVDLGSYRTGVFETTSTSAFWGFNESGKLIEIWVHKDRDSL